MSLYAFIRPFLRLMPTEKAHDLAVSAVSKGFAPGGKVVIDARLHQQVCGLSFVNPVGLAAGFDKNAQTLRYIFKHGFGFVECGTVTPRPQEGNPKPRLFRLSRQGAVINRMGFNNDGLDAYMRHLQKRTQEGIVGANIGKNKDSNDAVADYVTCLHAVYLYADYITVNVSSPNTQGLRDLQEQDKLTALASSLVNEREKLIRSYGLTRKPIFIKIAPDLDQVQQEGIAQIALSGLADGLIIGNTTITRPGMKKVPEHLQAGGMSGKPLMELSTQLLGSMYHLTKGKVPLIGVGGIASAEDAYAKIKAGASLVQLYSALVFQGFDLVSRINRRLPELLDSDGFHNLREAVGADYK